MAEHDDRTCRGACSCGWRGPWRKAWDDADKDRKAHCAEKGCKLGSAGVGSLAPQGDLMPHERYGEHDG